MAKPTWEIFMSVFAAVVVFIVPIVLYLMEKAGVSLVWIFVLGWISIAVASEYLVVNIPWIWDDANFLMRIWRLCFVSAIALLIVGYFAIKIWPHPMSVKENNELYKSEEHKEGKAPEVKAPEVKAPEKPAESTEKWASTAHTNSNPNGLSFTEVSPSKLGIEVPDTFLIAFGTNTAKVARETLKKQLPFEQILSMKFPGTMPLSIYFNKRGEMKVDATIFDERGNIAAKIKHGEFAVVHPGWDRNWDATGFEIVDAQNRPFFYIERPEPNTIRLLGIFRMSDGSLISINNDSFRYIPKVRVASTPVVPAVPTFTYPSHGNLHKRATP